MLSILNDLGGRLRIISTRLLERFGFKGDSFLVVPAILIGIVTAAAAVGFHELIYKIRDLLYLSVKPETLYGWRGLPLLILFPALGGLVVGIISKYIARSAEGHGIIDVIESVVKTSGFVRPATAIEKIITSAVTIGTGGSTGAEGPIVQIGAAIASGVGQLFRFARHQMPIIIGCGSAAGISAIFNAPIGGVIFTIEVILQDFSIRAFTPLVVASVIANVTTRAIFAHIGNGAYQAIFATPGSQSMQFIDWEQVPIFAFLGLLCGLVGVTLTKAMQRFEYRFHKIKNLGPFRPALGSALVGVLGIIFVLVFGRLLFHQPKPFTFSDYPMPAFFGDGYGVIHRLLVPDFYGHDPFSKLLLLLLFLCIAKIVATCLTLASGGSGGVIAPALFLGATTGGLLGLILRQTGWFAEVHPEVYALIGMGAGLAAVVHAPLTSILILLELTQDYRVTVPAMLATVVATGTARLIFPDSIYTHSLRLRGIKLGSASDLGVMRRMTVEQVELEPATIVQANDPAQRVLNLMLQLGTVTFIVIDEHGAYQGMVDSEEVNAALLQREALGAMIVGDLMRNVPLVKTSDDLAMIFDAFSRMDVAHLPVCIASTPDKAVGLISRAALMRTYQDAIGK